MENNNIALRMEGIVKNFGGILALDHAGISVQRGEIHALVGENGAGKSTLMKILAGIYRKNDGKIYVNEKEVSIQNPSDSVSLGIAFVHQYPNLVPMFDVARNIFLGKEPINRGKVIDWKELYSKTEVLLSNLQADISPKEYVKDLTIAEKQEVSIVRALSMEPQLIVFDEPTAPLTFKEVNRLFEIIYSLKRKNVTIIYISHRLDEIFQISDRITVLRNGKTIGTVKTRESNTDEVVQMMIGSDLELKVKKRKREKLEPAIEVKGLKTSQLNDPIDLALYKGEILGLFGLVGAGRTELARAIFGVDKSTEGSIWINGKEWKKFSPEKIINNGLAYVPEDRQSQGLIMDMAVKDNVTLANLNAFRKGPFIDHLTERKVVGDLIKKLSIKVGSMSNLVNSLSGGNQQKVVLAKWLCRNPQFFIFDEPTVGIDVGTKGEIYNLVNELAYNGASILFISSEPEEILRVADRILVMYRKRIAAKFSVEEASVKKLMSVAMGAEI